MLKVPEQTKDENITPLVVRGKKIWEENNCMGCHTLFGEGAYYAPELTKVVERRGVEWIRIFLKDPEAMFPGERKMVNYGFTDEDIDAVIAFFAWVGEVDLNGFPADPPLRHLLASANASKEQYVEAPAVFQSLCLACHSVQGKGGVVGPALDNAYSKYTAEAMRAWIADPQSVKPGTAMPQMPLNDEQLDGIVTYLQALKN